MKYFSTVFSISISILFISCGGESSPPQETPVEKPSPITTAPPQIEKQVVELSYIQGVAVAQILQVINKNKLSIHEKNPPSEKTISDSLIISEKFFSDFYRKTEGDYEIDIAITGLSDDLGSVSVIVRNIRPNAKAAKMRKMFNKIVGDLPKDLLPSTVKGKNFAKSFSQILEPSRVKGIFGQLINGIEYRFMDIDGEISIDIAKEGN